MSKLNRNQLMYMKAIETTNVDELTGELKLVESFLEQTPYDDDIRDLTFKIKILKHLIRKAEKSK